MTTSIFGVNLLFSATTRILEQAYQKFKGNHDGNVTNYIPTLASYSPNNFAITVATVDSIK